MLLKNRARRLAACLLLAPVMLLGCNFQSQVPAEPTLVPTLRAFPTMTAPSRSLSTPVPPVLVVEPTQIAQQPAASPEPAGCLSLDDEERLSSVNEMLDYADRLLRLPQTFSERILSASWNPYIQAYSLYGNDKNVLTLNVRDVENEFLIQNMLNALHVAGFVVWLRNDPKRGMMILAIPMSGIDHLDSSWLPYVQAYWQGPHSLPEGDPAVLPALKLPPCHWMIETGVAPQGDYSAWDTFPTGQPDYAPAAAAYLASTNEAAGQVARRIDWLGKDGLEGPNTMCGPLAWSILKDAGAFPPGWGGWSEGPRSFWLAKPRTNGRPWLLFPSYIYHLYSFKEPMGKFDFSKFPLYPGDFLYTYSLKDGYDHMFVITEVDGQGNVYTVTNKIQIVPKKQVTIERLLLLNLNDPKVGIARNQWANDQVNGRTGHAGFDVFRWSWVEKNINKQRVPYAVQPGDTLRIISALWKTPAIQIARYNGINEDAVLSVGQELEIPPNE